MISGTEFKSTAPTFFPSACKSCKCNGEQYDYMDVSSRGTGSVAFCSTAKVEQQSAPGDYGMAPSGRIYPILFSNGRIFQEAPRNVSVGANHVLNRTLH